MPQNVAESNLMKIPLGIHDEEVAVGSHIAYFWENEKEFNAGVRFLGVGLENGDFCVIFGHDEGNRRVVERLNALGYDCNSFRRRNRLAIVSGHPDAGQMLTNIGETFANAIKEGTTLIRLLGNIGWGHDGWPSEDDILAFESRVTGAARQFPCVIVCMYDVRALPGRVVVHGAFETHPMTICGNVLRQNTHYVEVDEFLQRLKPASTVV